MFLIQNPGKLYVAPTQRIFSMIVHTHNAWQVFWMTVADKYHKYF